MVSNLPQEQKENWANNEIVMPKDTNAWGSSINKLTKAIPIYTANGSFYTVQSYSNNLIILNPVKYEDDTENEIVNSYVNGMEVIFKSTFTNTDSCSVNVAGLGVKQIKTCENTDLISGIIEQGYFVKLIYDSTQDWFYFVKDNDDKKINTKANIHLDNLSEVGADKLNTSKMYMTGEVSTDDKAYNQLYDMAHSTFDLSKFKVVGSPTITDDGVASGFGASNYIQTNVFNPLNYSWMIKGCFTTDSTTSVIKQIYTNSNSVKGINIALTSSNKLALYLSSNGTSYDIGIIYSDIEVSPNVKYYFIAEFDGNETYKLTLFDGINYSVNTLISSLTIPENLVIGMIGYNSHFGRYFYGSIDLSQFSITVDGKEVFSGNKTGIDVIKPDNYKIVGSPVISEDGVASGFSSNNYINVPYKSLGQSFKIYMPKFKTTDVSQTQNVVRYSDGNIRFQIYQNKIRLFRYTDKKIYDLPKGQTTLQNNTDYYYYVEQTTDGINYFFKGYISTDGVNWNLDVDKTYSAPMYDYTNSAPIQISGVDAQAPFLGSIDLNAFKIYVYGNLVYQPCLKIPYTQSKTGSKIVDAVYRDRVIDLYEQEGQAGYYTIDDENKNFTLPMGEIYGMIEDSKKGYHPPLLSTMWSDHLLNDMAWLRADTFSWQDGNTYYKAYNEFLTEYNDSASVSETEGSITFKRTPKGYKIALATQETAILDKYNADGIAWFYILDTINKKFKLPRTKFGFEGLRTSVGDDITESLPNITGRVGGYCGLQIGHQDTMSYINGAFYQDTSAYSKMNYNVGDQANALGFDASRSSSTYQDGAPVQERATQMYLYFYVGEFTKSAQAQTAGLKAELLNGKLDVSNIKRYPIEISASSLMPSWYVVYNDGWCEQGGNFTLTSASNTVTLLKGFANTSYSVFITDGGSARVSYGYSRTATNQITIYGSSSGNGGSWMAKGFIA